MVNSGGNRNQDKVKVHKKPPSQAKRSMGSFFEYGHHGHQDQVSASPPDPHHALVTLDHEAFVLVEATDTADNVIILLMPILLFRD